MEPVLAWTVEPLTVAFSSFGFWSTKGSSPDCWTSWY